MNGREYVPQVLREKILKQLHESPLYGHRGSAALYGLLNRQFWWPDCHKDCIKYARGCESCQKNNPSTQKPYGFLQPLPAPEAAFRHLTLDFIGPLPICLVRDYSYRFILQVVDRLTKRVWIIPIERPTARETAEAFLNNVVRFAGLPDSLVSDQGRALIDRTWKEICSKLKITHKLSTSYHPETDGQTERANKTLEVYLRHFVNYYQDDWARHLSLAISLVDKVGRKALLLVGSAGMVVTLGTLAWIFGLRHTPQQIAKRLNLFQRCNQLYNIVRKT